jgi:broad specificity phosphatase PhoE
MLRRRRPLALARLAPLLLVAACSGAVTRAPEQLVTQTVIVVRHAERVDQSQDAALSDAGAARAEALAVALADAGVRAIYTTQYQRTRQTAAPLAKRLALEPRVVESAGDAAAHATEVARRVLQDPAPVVLVVGHSNTVPAIVAALGAPPVPAMTEQEYEHMYIVQRGGSGVRVIRGRLSR